MTKPVEHPELRHHPWTEKERRGRRILVLALVYLWLICLDGVLFPASGDSKKIDDRWLTLGISFLVVYFAYHGGRLSISFIRFCLFFPSMLLLFAPFIACAIWQYREPGEPPIDGFAALQASGELGQIFLGIAIMAWVFYFSPSVRDYIRYRRLCREFKFPDPRYLPDQPLAQSKPAA